MYIYGLIPMPFPSSRDSDLNTYTTPQVSEEGAHAELNIYNYMIYHQYKYKMRQYQNNFKNTMQ